jgi:flagellar protein FlaJ
MYFQKRYRQAVWGVSLIIGVITAVLLLLGRYKSTVYLIPIDMSLNYSLLLSILIAIIPPSIVELNNISWLKQVDKNIPKLMMDLTESIRSGMPMIRALEEASQRDYGPISKKLEIAVVNFNLTSDFDGSMRWFGESLIQPSGKRMATILTEAQRSGGKMVDVLDTSIAMFTSLASYREEKESQISPYIMLVYVSSLIFLFIGWVLITQFLMPMTKQQINTPGIPSILGGMLSIDYYKSIIFWAAVVEGLIGGLVAGKIQNSKLFSGLVHSVFLISITYLFYLVLLP